MDAASPDTAGIEYERAAAATDSTSFIAPLTMFDRDWSAIRPRFTFRTRNRTHNMGVAATTVRAGKSVTAGQVRTRGTPTIPVTATAPTPGPQQRDRRAGYPSATGDGPC